MTRETFAAIDIGSNAFRLLISYVERGGTGVGSSGSDSEGSEGAVEFKKAAFIRVPVRLGEDVFTHGEIGPAKRERLVEAMQAFAHLMRVFEVKAHRACATSAMREAANGPAIVEEIRSRSGIAVEIISGRQEAETIFEAGDIAGLMNSDKRYLYVDVGGGSTEVTVYSNRRRACSESFALGTVRTLSGGVDPAECERFRKWLKSVRTEYKPVAIIGSGGNINKAHKMLAGKERETLRLVELELLAEQLSEMSLAERIERMGLNDYRADVIAPALDLFITAARTCRIDQIIVPKIGLVDGIIHSLSRAAR